MTRSAPRSSPSPFAAPLALCALATACTRENREPLPVHVEEALFLLNLRPERIGLDGEPGLDLAQPRTPLVARRSLTIGFSTRKCLQQARGTAVEFRSVLEPGATVRFEVGFGLPEGVSETPVPEAGERYALELAARDANGAEQVLWSEELVPPAAGAEHSWRLVECPAPFASGDLVLRTLGEPEARIAPTAPGWASPRIVSASPRPAPPLGSRRNTIVFLVDTLRADHVGPFGGDPDKTPTLDALARRSLVFTEASSAAPWTKASVASVMTSRHPSRHGTEGVPDRLRDSEITLARTFGDAGYDTAAVGFNAWVFSRRFNVTLGFQDVIEVFDQEREGGARADSVVAEALDWILQRRDRPFFLYMHAIDPHEPYVPSAEDRARWVPEYHGSLTGRLEGPGQHQPKKRSEVSQADIEFVEALYDAEISFADRMLGYLVRRLEELGLWDETTLVFTADHGEEFLEHGHWSHGGKLYQEQLHVPLLLKPPASAGLAPRRRVDPVSLVDVAPTLLELAGIPIPATFDGQSLLSYGDGVRRKAPILAELHKEGQHAFSLRDGDLKYIQVLAPRPREEVYDLASDPGETRNRIAETEPALLETLRRFSTAHWAAAGTRGLYVEVLGDGTPAMVQVYVESADPELDGDLREAERESDFISSRVGARGNRLISARLALDAEDRRDLVLVDPKPGASLEVRVDLDGQPMDPGRILLGRGAQAASAARWTLTADAPELLTDAPPEPLEGRTGVWCRVWQVRPPETDEGPAGFDGELLESLRALGYVR